MAEVVIKNLDMFNLSTSEIRGLCFLQNTYKLKTSWEKDLAGGCLGFPNPTCFSTHTHTHTHTLEDVLELENQPSLLCMES